MAKITLTTRESSGSRLQTSRGFYTQEVIANQLQVWERPLEITPPRSGLAKIKEQVINTKMVDVSKIWIEESM